jgi:hypothetical protein
MLHSNMHETADRLHDRGHIISGRIMLNRHLLVYLPVYAAQAVVALAP